MEHNVVYIGNNRCKLYVGSSRSCVVTESALPYDAEVEYLESTGTQWIELGIYGSNDLDFIIDFEPLDLTETNRTWTGTGSYFGVRAEYNYELSGYNRSTTTKGCFFFYTYGDASGYTKQVGLTSTRQTVSKSGTNLIRPDGTSTALTNGSNEYTTTQTIAVFARKNSNGVVNTYGKMKLYSLKFEKNNETILDLVPVRKGQVGYLYDKKNGNLLRNSGSGNFILGNDVFIVPIEYLECSGTQRIDTRIMPNQYTDVYMEVEIPQDKASTNITFFQVYNTQDISNCYGIMSLPVNNQFQFRRWTRASISGYYLQGDTKYTIYTDGNKLYVNNELKITASAPAEFQVNYDLNIFASLDGAHNTYSCTNGFKCYCFKIYSNNVLVRDFIPVRVGQKGYMLDRLSNELFGNTGTGDFILGNDKT